MSAAKLRRSALAPTASKWRSAGERDERVDPLFEIRFTDDVDLPMGDAVVERGKGELLVDREMVERLTIRLFIRNRKAAESLSATMSDDKVYDEPSHVNAEDGAVNVDGPDAVAVKITPDAAERTGESLIEESLRARGQRRLKDLPHKPA